MATPATSTTTCRAGTFATVTADAIWIFTGCAVSTPFRRAASGASVRAQRRQAFATIAAECDDALPVGARCGSRLTGHSHRSAAAGA